MKTGIFLSLLILAPIGQAAHAAEAGASIYSDFEVISVKPRATAVKPFVMAIFTPEQRQRIALAAQKKTAR